MNKTILTAAFLASLATSMFAQYVPRLDSLETNKTWAISADVRGFYDDNYLTLPKGLASSASWGWEVSPSAAFYHSSEDTTVSVSYLFDARQYENNRPQGSTLNPAFFGPLPHGGKDTGTLEDYTHELNGHLDHQFWNRYKLSLSESLVDAQEPTVLDPVSLSDPFRVRGDNLRNTGQIDLTVSLTKDLDLRLGYGNTLYRYQQTARSVVGYGFNEIGETDPGGAAYVPVPSQSALLDRMEQLAMLDLRWKATADTTAVLAYQFGHTDYTAPEYIIFPSPPYNSPVGGPGAAIGFTSNIRNNDAHYAFVGVDENFTPDLRGFVRAGIEFLDYYNDHTSRLSPYVDAGLTYNYQTNCAAQLGVKHIHNATDVVVLDEESTIVYVSETHQFFKKFTATLTGQLRDSTYTADGGHGEDFGVAGIDFAYHFTPWLLAEAGYNYSRLSSSPPSAEFYLSRQYTRNFGFAGIRGTWGN